MNNFERCLMNGKFYETECLKYINHKSYIQSEGKCKEWDLEIENNSGHKIKIEVKSDRHINLTGNICIEYKCNNKDSGITSSTSIYWVIFEVFGENNYNMYIVKSKIIKQMIKDRKYKRDVRGGDGYRAQLYLFDKSLFKDYIKVKKIENNIEFI